MNIDKIKELKLDEATEKFATTLMGEIDGMVKSAKEGIASTAEVEAKITEKMATLSERIGIIIKALTGRTLYSDETYENLNYQLLVLKEQLNLGLS